MKIGILGGSFDPPHIGHVLIVQQTKEFQNLDQIWLMPNYSHAFGKNQTDTKHRFEMTKLLRSEFIKVSDIEINNKEISYTIDTLEYCVKNFPQDEFFWILGSDQLEVFQKYKDWKKIISNYNLIVFPREAVLSEIESRVKKSFDLKSVPKNIIILSDKSLILTNISSSMIRKRLKEKKSIKNLVTKAVENYILKHHLYEK